MKVNPFNQPAVENVKILTKKINFKVKNVDLNLSLVMKGIKFEIISKNQISAVYEKNSLIVANLFIGINGAFNIL